MFDRDGADAMRWFLMSSPILRGGNLVVTEQGIRDGVRQVLLPLWNAWYFFSLYANAARGGQGYEAQWSTGVARTSLDRYLLAKLRELVERRRAPARRVRRRRRPATRVRELPRRADQLVHPPLARPVLGRRERRVDAAFDTLYTALEVADPGLRAAAAARHRGDLARPDRRAVRAPDRLARRVDDLPADDALVAAMDRAREVCSAALSLRKAAGLRGRLPLHDAHRGRAGRRGALEPFGAIVADEVNVKRGRAARPRVGQRGATFGVSQRLTVNARAAGPRLGKDVQRAIKGAKSGDWSVDADGVVTAGGLALVEGEYTLETVVAPAAEGGAGHARCCPAAASSCSTPTVTPELAPEGLARDVVRAVQQARRDAGLDVSDRISLTVLGDQQVWEATVAHQTLIMEETLATQFGSAPDLDALPAGAADRRRRRR